MSSKAPGPRHTAGLTRKGQQTRQRIVAAAADLILQQGVAGTTLDDVRAEAGVSSSQIYHYFADKEALVRAVVDYRAQTVVGEIHEPALAAIEGIDGLRTWRDMIVSIQRDADCAGGCPLGSLADSVARPGRPTRPAQLGTNPGPVQSQILANALPGPNWSHAR
jgi:TetR/AcrR family transcriptional regulator, transcriptional repressor for nem operon